MHRESNDLAAGAKTVAKWFALDFQEIVRTVPISDAIVQHIEVTAGKVPVVTLVLDAEDVVGSDNSTLREFISGSSLKDFKVWESR